MRELDPSELAREVADPGLKAEASQGPSRAAELRLRPDWAWLGSPEFRAYLIRRPVTKKGLCVSPITPDLAESLREEERTEEEGNGHTHTPPKK